MVVLLYILHFISIFDNILQDTAAVLDNSRTNEKLVEIVSAYPRSPLTRHRHRSKVVNNNTTPRRRHNNYHIIVILYGGGGGK